MSTRCRALAASMSSARPSSSITMRSSSLNNPSRTSQALASSRLMMPSVPIDCGSHRRRMKSAFACAMSALCWSSSLSWKSKANLILAGRLNPSFNARSSAVSTMPAPLARALRCITWASVAVPSVPLDTGQISRGSMRNASAKL